MATSTSFQPLWDIATPLLEAQWNIPLEAIKRQVEAEFQIADLEDFYQRFQDEDLPWGYYPKSQVSQFVVTEIFKSLQDNIVVTGDLESLIQPDSDHPHVIISNHLSYGDAIALKVGLEHKAQKALPFLGLAGPKAYETPFKRFMVMFMNSIKIPQPIYRHADPSTTELKDLSRHLKKAISEVEAQQKNGQILQFFPEGGRSREGQMIHFSPGSARFFRGQPIIYPIGLIGTESLMGVQHDHIQAKNIEIRIGTPIPWTELKNKFPESFPDHRKQQMDHLGRMVAELLPSHLQGVYGPQECQSTSSNLSSQ